MTGIITLSVELELGWGMHDMGEFSHLSDDRSSEEIALSRLLNLCEKHSIVFSFDIVGHLFEKSCAGQHNGLYPDSWWKNDPGTSYREDPLFYSPELINEIIESPVNHEICTHTYSHILTEEMSEDILHQELKMAMEIHQRWDLPPFESIVIPRHQQVDYSILSKYNIKTIRRPIQEYGPSDTNSVAKLWWFMTRDHPESELKSTDNILETTCTPHPSLASTMLPSGQKKTPPYFRFLPQRVREHMHYRYLKDAIDFAADNGTHIHLWTHLYNIANKSQLRAIKPALDHLGNLQKQGDLEVCRMCDLPEVAQ